MSLPTAGGVGVEGSPWCLSSVGTEAESPGKAEPPGQRPRPCPAQSRPPRLAAQCPAEGPFSALLETAEAEARQVWRTFRGHATFTGAHCKGRASAWPWLVG